MNGRGGVNYITGFLLLRIFSTQRTNSIKKREARRFNISFLNLHLRIIQAPAINAWRSAGFHSSGSKSKFQQLLRYSIGGLIAHSSSAKLFFAYMYFPVKE